MTYSEKRRAVVVVILALPIAFTLMFVGYVKTYLDHEEQTTLFIKYFPTLKMQFYDPFANEGEDIPIDKLSTRAREEFAKYCKYRFGVVDTATPALDACKAQIPNYLKSVS
ncbi:hypothetical protein [Pandoraea norimbergensis]|uniref:Uncharacterized protein n=1 Tax=Pandoraea norimbergensis TaxID=93219 RepID=A0ABM5WKU7_9BURK|nr:hypothetical protein [Pandoraea norimbergensis]ALS60600.1 hypothetical protein AT302_13230 [Pandoraea norimbergensis]